MAHGTAEIGQTRRLARYQLNPYPRITVSKELFTFFLKELKAVRLMCKNANCGGVIEVPVDKIENLAEELWCPACQSPIRSRGRPVTITFHDHLSMFAAAIKELTLPTAKMNIEFVLADRPEAVSSDN
jgi:hypothetical protein